MLTFSTQNVLRIPRYSFNLLKTYLQRKWSQPKWQKIAPTQFARERYVTCIIFDLVICVDFSCDIGW